MDKAGIMIRISAYADACDIANAAPGREVVQMRVEIDPGHGVPKHTHPGDEVLYVVEGTLEFESPGLIDSTRSADV